MKKLISAIPILLLAVVAEAATLHYVDNSIATGANDGSSWPNAWHSFAAINFGSINLGDTIYISGGANGQTYTEAVCTINGKSGTIGNPITWKPGQHGDTGHDGPVTFDGNYVDANGTSYVTFSGNDGTGAHHFKLIKFFNTSERTFGNKIVMGGSTGDTVEYCDFDRVNQAVTFYQSSGSTKFTVQYCTITCQGDCAIRAISSYGGFDANIVQFNTIHTARYVGSDKTQPWIGPDGVQASDGITVRYNVFSPVNVTYLTSTQHPDQTQLTGNFIKIYGNEFNNIADSGNDFDFWNNPHPHDIWIFNNVYHITQAMDPFPEFIRFYASSTGVGYTDLTNFKVWNNTFIDDAGWSAILIAWNSRAGAANPTFSGVEFKNNLFVNCGAFSVAIGNPNFNNSSFTLAHNSFSANCSFSWNGKSYDGTTFSEVEPDRIVGTPAFTSYVAKSGANNFHLLGTDTVAKGNGVELSASFTTDFDQKTRVAPWDIGSYAYASGGGGSPPSPPAITSPPADPSPSTLENLRGHNFRH